MKYQEVKNERFVGYYGPEIPLGQPEMCNLCPCCRQPIPAPVEQEWTVEEILAREG